MIDLLNRLWRLSCRREASAFRRALQDPQRAQSQTLGRMLEVLGPCDWGDRWGLSPRLPVDRFREQVPLTDYSFYEAAIRQIASNGTNPLTTQRVDLLEPTRGTSAGEKLIPYTSRTTSRVSAGDCSLD